MILKCNNCFKTLTNAKIEPSPSGYDMICNIYDFDGWATVLDDIQFCPFCGGALNVYKMEQAEERQKIMEALKAKRAEKDTIMNDIRELEKKLTEY